MGGARSDASPDASPEFRTSALAAIAAGGNARNVASIAVASAGPIRGVRSGPSGLACACALRCDAGVMASIAALKSTRPGRICPGSMSNLSSLS